MSHSLILASPDAGSEGASHFCSALLGGDHAKNGRKPAQETPPQNHYNGYIVMEKKWNILPDMPQEMMSQFPEYPRIISQLLYNRNLKTQEQIDEFFNSDYEADLHDPFLHKGMLEGVNRIKEAIDKKEKIIVYGDYDADGVSASVVLHTILKELGADFDVYIPDRYKDGYGLTEKSIKEFHGQKVKLIITVDCGITNVKEVKLANNLEIDVIITDHHLPKDELPQACVVIDSRQKDDTYPFKWLCGGALAFKLAQAILNCQSVGIKWDEAKNIKPGFEKWLLDVVSLCTITDMVPLIGENRTLAKYGFLVMAQTKRKGLKELMRLAGLEPKIMKQSLTGELFSNIGSYEIGFVIGPRINAAGRLEHASTAFDLLVTDDQKEAEALAKHLEGTNFERQRIIEIITKEVEERLSETYRGKLPNVIFEGSTEWPAGVVGIVAGRLTDKYSRPAFIYSRGEKNSKGSCRSIKSFNLAEEMEKCADILETFGGHAFAAGFSLSNENLKEFQEQLLELTENLKEEDLQAVINIDGQLDFGDVNWEIYDHLKNFEPFGKENDRPVFLIKNLKVKDLKWVGSSANHMQIWLVPSKVEGLIDAGSDKFMKPLKGVAFRFEDFKDRIKVGNIVDVVFEIDVNEWNGSRELQLIIRDLKIVSSF